MRLMELSVSVWNAGDVFPHGIPGVATLGLEKSMVGNLSLSTLSTLPTKHDPAHFVW